MVMPGDNVTMTVTLIVPIAMEEGLRFAIREGGAHRGRRRGCQDPRISDLRIWDCDESMSHRSRITVSYHGIQQASSSIGRASVSKTEGWGFETLLACHIISSLLDTS